VERARTVAVTGATGFIGGHVTQRLLERGWRVRAIVRPGGRREVPPGVERVTAPLHVADLTEACAGADAIIHLAGRIRAATPRQFHAVNVEGTRAVAEAARAAGARLVLVSSLAAAGPGTPSRPRTEDDTPEPITPYGRSKLAAEQVVRRMPSLRWTIVRPALVYGPGDRSFLPLFRLAARGLVLDVAPSSSSPAYTLIHAADVATGIEQAASVPAALSGTFFLGHDERVTADSIVAALARIEGRTPYRIGVPWPVVALAATAGQLAAWCGRPWALDRARLAELRAPGWVCSVRCAERIGFQARIPMGDGFASTAAHYRRCGWL
jgi:nucleoside-diphosphate-sugar epimerase